MVARSAARSRDMKIHTAAKARMPIGRLMKNTQRQEKLSVSQPPSTGPKIGPRIAPAPQIAITWPDLRWAGRCRAPPPARAGSAPRRRGPAAAGRPRSRPGCGRRRTASRRSVKPAIETRNISLAADPDRQPAGERRHDRRGDDVGGQHPGDLVLGGRHAARHVRQRDVGDGRVQRVHHRRQHQADGDGNAVGDVLGGSHGG